MPRPDQEHIAGDFGIGFCPTFEWYSRELSSELRAAFPSVDIRVSKFPNDMPLIMVDSARHVLLPHIINGDDWEKAILELMFIGNTFTDNPDIAGSNCERLSILLTFGDFRQDARTRKPIPDSINTAIVKKQFVFTRLLAKILKDVSGARDVTAFEMHSHKSFKAFTDNGLEIMNITSMKLFADYLLTHLELFNSERETIIGTTDYGDLNRAYPLHNFLGFPIAVVEKLRIASEDGTTSKTTQKLIYGDPQDKQVVLVDDMISGGRTLLDGVQLYESLGAKEFIIFITHPVCVDNYYENIQQLLLNPKVKCILFTNSIPFSTRFSGVTSVPYIGTGVTRKAVDILDINPLMIEVIKTIAATSTLKEAKELLGDHVWDMRDPFELACEITGLPITRPRDTHVYDGNGLFKEI